MKIEIDGAVRFCHKNFNDLEAVEDGEEAQKYDLEEYTLPPVVRKILRGTKLNEVVFVKSTRADKLTPQFEDASGVFSKDNLAFQKEAVITFALVAFESKDHLFKLPIF